MAKITVKIPREGLSLGKRKIAFEVEGVTGESCTDITAGFERALSSVPADVSLKPEYYDTHENEQHIDSGS